MRLFEKYRQASLVIVGVMSTLFVYITTIVYPHVTDSKGSNTSLIAFILASSSVYTLFYFICLWVYEKVGWKLIHHRDNFSGRWEMTVTYEFLERAGPDSAELPLPFSFHSVFKIDQTATSLRFPEGYSAPNEVWKDRSSRLTADGIDMSYEVTRSDKSPHDALPPQTYGFEIVRVTSLDKFGRPASMAGTMYHAALPDVNLYRGRTQYDRISRKAYDKLLKDLIAATP